MASYDPDKSNISVATMESWLSADLSEDLTQVSACVLRPQCFKSNGGGGKGGGYLQR